MVGILCFCMHLRPFVDEAGDVCELVVEEEAAKNLEEMAVLLQAPVTLKGSHPQHLGPM